MRYILAMSVCATLGAASVACGTTGAQQRQQNTSTCPAPGTEVPYAKVMSSGFAKRYVGCDVVVKADYFAPSTQNITAWVKDGYAQFQTLDRGGAPSTNPLAGAIGFLTAVPNAAADVVFTLKPGDHIAMRGGTAIRQSAAAYFEVMFVASSIRKE